MRKDGKVIWVQVIRSSLRDTEENRLSTVGIVQSLNEQRQADAKIKFQAYLLENVHDAIIATNNELQITTWNRAAEELYGWTVEEVLGCPIIEVTQSELSKEERTAVQEQIDSGNKSIVETIHHHKDGHSIYVEARGTILHDENGQPVGYVTAVRDISRRKQAEDELQKLNSELENRVKERTAELRRLSQRLVEVQEEERRAFARELHDRVGQILSALNIDLQMVKDQLAGEAEKHLKSRVEDSMQLVAEATALVHGLLTELRSAILDDEGLQAALKEYIAQYTTRYGIEVHHDISIPSNLRLKPALEVTLLRIAQEALTNVARYAKTTEATVLLQLENDIIYLTIADKGIGIDASKSDGNHVGHGLKIMLERAQAYGGTVTIESSKENGTRVNAVIPL